MKGGDVEEIMEMNERGEVAGHGPRWACADYGGPGHDYMHCYRCWQRYEAHLELVRGRMVVMGEMAICTES
ncbi:MAG TPA: hypothetical protein VF795_11740 [Desulfuromonadaceae bacterium]